MKKIYALAAAAFLGLAANAQDGAPLYYTGDGIPADMPEFTTWAPEAPAQFAYANGVYTLKVNGLFQFKVSTAMGDWDTFNGAALGCGEEGYGDEPGVVKPLVSWGENTLCPWKGDYTIEVAGDLSTIKLTTDTPKPDPTDHVVLFFRGDINGWESGAEWELKYLGNNVYKFECAEGQQILPGEGWKIATDPWDDRYNYGSSEEILFSDAEVTIENEFQCAGSSPNTTLTEEWNGVAYFQIGEPGAPAMFVISNDKELACPWEVGIGIEGVTVENNSVAAYYTIDGVRVANPENGLYIVVKDGKASKVLVK